MNQSSRGFKILNAVSNGYKENQNAKKDEKKLLNLSTQPTQNVIILSNISLNVHNNHKTSLEVNTSKKIQKKIENDENSEMTFAIEMLKNECSMVQDILEIEDKANCREIDQHSLDTGNLDNINICQRDKEHDCSIENINLENIILDVKTGVGHEETEFDASNTLEIAVERDVVGISAETAQDETILYEKNLVLQNNDINDNATTETERRYEQDEEQQDVLEYEWVPNEDDSTDADNVSDEERRSRSNVNLIHKEDNNETPNDEGRRKRKRTKSRLSNSLQWEYNRNKKKEKKDHHILEEKITNLLSKKTRKN